MLIVFGAYQKNVALVGHCSGKYILVAAFLHLEPVSQFGYGQWKVAGGDVGLVYSSKRFSQFFLVHGCYARYGELTAREVVHGAVGHKEVAALVYLPYMVALFNDVEASGFHNRGILVRKDRAGLRKRGL